MLTIRTNWSFLCLSFLPYKRLGGTTPLVFAGRLQLQENAYLALFSGAHRSQFGRDWIRSAPHRLRASLWLKPKSPPTTRNLPFFFFYSPLAACLCAHHRRNLWNCLCAFDGRCIQHPCPTAVNSDKLPYHTKYFKEVRRYTTHY